MSRSKNEDVRIAIYNYINKYSNENGVAPSVREIAAHFNYAPSNVQRYLTDLIEDGKILRNGTRNIKTRLNDSPLIQIPIVGNVSCGLPLLAEQNIEEYFPFKKEYIGNGEFFILKAHGDSMIEANIDDGDLVVVKIQNYANNGQIVVALIDDEATLKRFYKENNKIRLHPENKDMDDMYFDDIIIQGVATKIIKNID